MELLQQDILQEHINSMAEDSMDDFIDSLYPEITLETDDIIMAIAVKKDYSKIKDLTERKKEFLKDLDEFIKEFSETPESDDFMRYFED